MEHQEVVSEIDKLQEDIKELENENFDLKEEIARMDIAFDPILKITGSDPDDAIKRMCKELLIEFSLIQSN